MYLKKKIQSKQEQWWLRRNFYFYHTGLFTLEKICKIVGWPDIVFCFNEDHFAKHFCLTLLFMHFLDMLKIPSTYGLRKFGFALYSSQFGQLNILFSKWESYPQYIKYITWWITYIARNAWWARDRNVFTNLHQHSKAAPFPTNSAKQEFCLGKGGAASFSDSNSCSVNSMETRYRKLSAKWPCKIMAWMGFFCACYFAELALRQLFL